MWVMQTAMMVDLPGQVRCDRLGDLFDRASCPGETVSSEMDRPIRSLTHFSIGARRRKLTFADHTADCVSSDDLESLACQLLAQFLICVAELHPVRRASFSDGNGGSYLRLLVVHAVRDMIVVLTVEGPACRHDRLLPLVYPAIPRYRPEPQGNTINARGDQANERDRREE